MALGEYTVRAGIMIDRPPIPITTSRLRDVGVAAEPMAERDYQAMRGLREAGGGHCLPRNREESERKLVGR